MEIKTMSENYEKKDKCQSFKPTLINMLGLGRVDTGRFSGRCGKPIRPRLGSGPMQPVRWLRLWLQPRAVKPHLQWRHLVLGHINKFNSIAWLFRDGSIRKCLLTFYIITCFLFCWIHSIQYYCHSSFLTIQMSRESICQRCHSMDSSMTTASMCCTITN